jgi:hypothetical protein
LLVVSLLLLVLTAAAAFRLRHQWLAARAREQAVLQQRVKPVPPPRVAPLPAAAPVKPANYIDIAQKMLFAKDRNPIVIVEAPPPPKPKPMPPLPIFYGLLDLGDGPAAILSEKPGAPNRDFRAGDQIGEFKLVALNDDEIVLEWDGKTITKKVSEMFAAEAPPPAQSAAPAAAAPRPAAKPAPALPGPALGPHGLKACQPGDSSGDGTVAEGMRKVIKNTPFGRSCFWEPEN